MGNSIVQLQAASIFQNKQLILKDVSIDVSAGELCFFFIGKTGTGKSSLIKTLYADLPLQEGMGSIVGYDLAKIKQKEIPFLRRKLGVVFQDFKLLPDRSMFENLRFVLKATGWKDKSKINSRIEEVLTEVGMANVAPNTRLNSRAENSNAWPLHVLCSIPPASLLPMNPPETSTRKPASKLWRSFANYTKKA